MTALGKGKNVFLLLYNLFGVRQNFSINIYIYVSLCLGVRKISKLFLVFVLGKRERS